MSGKMRVRGGRRGSIDDSVNASVGQTSKPYKSSNVSFDKMVQKHSQNQSSTYTKESKSKLSSSASKNSSQARSNIAKQRNKPIPQGWIMGETPSITSKYKLGSRIGSAGSYGYCVTATEIGQTKPVVAVKVISKDNLAKVDYTSLRTELLVMQKLKHTNLIELYDAYETDSTLYIVMELCQGGELFDLMKLKKTFSEKECASILGQIMSGLKYMHNEDVAHCDIKPDNFMFLTKDWKTSTVKIIDFGMAKLAKDRDSLTDISGTAYYVAPEVLKGSYTKHCDMWSIGVVMFVMLFGYPPFTAEDIHGDEIVRQLNAGFSPSVREGKGAWFPAANPVSNAAMDLITQCLTQSPASRITATEFMKHPFITGDKAVKKPRTGNMLKDLTAYRSLSATKQRLLEVVMHTALTEHELAELRTRFASLDVKGQGHVSVEDMQQHSRAGLMSSRGKRELNKHLTNTESQDAQSRALRYKEFVLAATHKKLVAKEERLVEAYKMLDSDADGVVSGQDLRRSLGVSANRAAEILDAIDPNHNSCVEVEAFIAYWGKPVVDSSATSKKSHSRRSSITEDSNTSNKKTREGKSSTGKSKKGGVGLKLAAGEDMLYIEAISKDLPAHIAGLKVRDVIRKVQSTYVTTMPEFVQVMKKHAKPGATLQFEIKRGMQVKKVSVQL